MGHLTEHQVGSLALDECVEDSRILTKHSFGQSKSSGVSPVDRQTVLGLATAYSTFAIILFLVYLVISQVVIGPHSTVSGTDTRAEPQQQLATSNSSGKDSLNNGFVNSYSEPATGRTVNRRVSQFPSATGKAYVSSKKKAGQSMNAEKSYLAFLALTETLENG